MLRWLRGDRWGAALAALALAQAAWFSAWLVVPDLNLDYPFLGGDGRDWISCGLALAGEDVRDTARPPLLPAIVAALDGLGLLRWLPSILQAVFALGVVGLYAFLAARAPRWIAFAVALAVLASGAVQHVSFTVGGDLPAAVLLGGAAAAFLAALERPRLYPLAGALAGLAALAQQAALLLPLPAGATLLAFRRAHLQSRPPWVGAALFAAPPAAWFLAKRLRHGTWGDAVTQHWGLLGWNGDGAGFYLHAGLALLGWPLALLAAVGAIGAIGGIGGVRRARRDPEIAFLLLLLASLIGFFALAYRHEAQRFLLYAVLPLGWLAARGLVVVEGRIGRTAAGAAAVAVVLWAAWPVPGRPGAETRWLVWPAPAVSAQPGESGVLLARSGVSWSQSPYALVPAVRARLTPADAPDPRLWVRVASAVFLTGEGESVAERYAVQYGLGNALRTRVKVVPATLYPEWWWGWAGLEAFEETAGWVLFRLRLPPGLGGAERPFAVAAAAGTPVAVRLRRAAAGGAALEPQPPAEDLARSWARARSLDPLVEGPDGFAVLLAAPDEAGEWARLVPFALGTSSLFVPADDERKDLRAALAAGPVLERFALDGIAAWRTRHLGWRVLVAEPEG